MKTKCKSKFLARFEAKHVPNSQERQIYYVVTINGKKCLIYLQHRVHPDNWINANIEGTKICYVKRNTFNNARTPASQINDLMKKVELVGSMIYERHYKGREDIFDSKEFRALITSEIEELGIKKEIDSKNNVVNIVENNDETEISEILEYIDITKYVTVTNFDLKNRSLLFWYDLYMKDRSTKVSVGRYKQYKMDGKRLEMYAEHLKKVLIKNRAIDIDTKISDVITFENFNLDGYYNFISSQAERSNNTLIQCMKRLRAFFNHCKQDFSFSNDKMTFRLIHNSPFEFIDFSEKFGSERYDEPISLTKEELRQLYKYNKFINEHHRFIRDMFCLQSNIGCRVYDFFNTISYDNIIEVGDIRMLIYQPHKTEGITASVPLSDMAEEIIKKYDGMDKNNRLMPFCSEQEYNRTLKDVFESAGLTRKILRYDFDKKRKYWTTLNKEASSHLARKTFIDIFYQNGEELSVIASMSGHSPTSKAIHRYKRRPQNLQIKAVKNVLN